MTLLVSGLALAHGPAVSVSAPSSVTAGAPFKVRVSGYFNCSRKSNPYTCSDVAAVWEVNGAVTCSKRFPHKSALKSGVGGPDRWLREGHLKGGISTRDPGPFSDKFSTKAPATAGHYTLCAYAFNFPVGTVQKVATSHFSVKP